MRHGRQGLIQRVELAPDHVGVVDVGGSAHAVRDRRERHARELQTVAGPLEAGVREERRRRLAGQYALAHTASDTVGWPHHMHVAGTSGERNSGSGSTRMVALVFSLISASHSPRPQNPL